MRKSNQWPLLASAVFSCGQLAPFKEESHGLHSSCGEEGMSLKNLTTYTSHLALPVHNLWNGSACTARQPFWVSSFSPRPAYRPISSPTSRPRLVGGHDGEDHTNECRCTLSHATSTEMLCPGILTHLRAPCVGLRGVVIRDRRSLFNWGDICHTRA